MNEVTNNVVAALPAINTGSVFNELDWAVIALFIIGMFAVVLFSMRKKNESGKDYFCPAGTPTGCKSVPPSFPPTSGQSISWA